MYRIRGRRYQKPTEKRSKSTRSPLVIAKTDMREVARRFCGLIAASLMLVTCDKPSPTFWVSARREARMSANELYNLGIDAFEQGFFEDCERVFRSVVVRKRMVQAFVNLGICQFAQGASHYDRALQSFTHAVKLNPSVPQARLGLGLMFVVTGSVSEAQKQVKYFERSGMTDFARTLRQQVESEASTKVMTDYVLFGRMPVRHQGPGGIMGN